MRKKKSIFHILSNEDGAVIMITMVVLIAVTALGITMMNLGNSEMQMVTNDKLKEDSFYDADTCNVATARFIRHLGYLDAQGVSTKIDAEDPKWAPGVRYPEDTTAAEVGDRILRVDQDYLEPDKDGKPVFFFQEDLGFIPDRLAAVADIRPRGSESVAGGASNQQNAGYSAGIGTGGAGSGGEADMYIIACEGRGLGADTVQAASRTFVVYRRLLGNLAGGL